MGKVASEMDNPFGSGVDGSPPELQLCPGVPGSGHMASKAAKPQTAQPLPGSVISPPSTKATPMTTLPDPESVPKVPPPPMPSGRPAKGEIITDLTGGGDVEVMGDLLQINTRIEQINARIEQHVARMAQEVTALSRHPGKGSSRQGVGLEGGTG